MPHQCTSCGRAFEDGSKEMLSGCPNCGGNKFQYRPSSVLEGPADADGTAATEPDAGDTTKPTDAEPNLTDSEFVSTPTDSELPEDRAQADARSGIVSEEELSQMAESASREAEESTSASTPPEPQPGPGVGDKAETTESPEESERVDRPDLSQLREELNSQFESIKIVSQGQYELNLMELYDRQEYIISLQEDGRYVIEMPDAWGPEDE